MKKLLTIKEVSAELGLTEEKVRALVDGGKLSAYRIAGSLLRFDSEQIRVFAAGSRKREADTPVRLTSYPGARAPANERQTFWDRLVDCVRFNDFYFFCILLIAGLLLLILR